MFYISFIIVVKKSITIRKSRTSALLLTPLLELLSALNLCKPANSALLTEAKACLLHIDIDLPYQSREGGTGVDLPSDPVGFKL